MSTAKKRPNYRAFTHRHGRHAHIAAKDLYLFAPAVPEFRFNIIGAGTMGLEHLRVTHFEGRATVHGVYDRSALSVENAQRAHSALVADESLVVYDSLEAACNDPEVDGLIICTPNFTHIEVLRTAIASGKHILLEKPMATRIEDAYEMVRMAERTEAVFQIGLQYRYKAIYTEAQHEALERRTLGDVKTISMVEHRIPFLDKVGQWNKFSKYSGGTLVEKCCHYFDLITLFAQSRPAEVFASGNMAVNFLDLEYDEEKSDILDNALVVIAYENGIRASFQLCMFAPMFYEELVLCGDEGRLRAYENEDFLPGERLKTGLEIYCGEHRPSRMATPAYPTVLEEAGHNGSTYFEHVRFVDAIAGEETDCASVAEAFWSIVIGVAAERSVATGDKVSIAALLDEAGVEL